MAITVTQLGEQVFANNVIQVQLYGFQLNQLTINTFYQRVASTTGGAVYTSDVVMNAEDAAEISLAGHMPTNFQFLGGRARVINPASGILGKAGVVASTAIGTSTFTGLPFEVAGLLTLQTDLAGRAYRGRLYLPAPDVDSTTTTATPTTTYVNAMNTYASITIGIGGINITGTTGGVASVVPVLYHRASKSFTTVTGAAGQKKWAVQHKRGNYGRPNLPYIPL